MGRRHARHPQLVHVRPPPPGPIPPSHTLQPKTNTLPRISILVSGSYAGWKLRRLAEYDEYHHPINVKPFGFNSDLKHAHHPTGSTSSHARVLSDDLDWDPELEMGNTVEITSTPASPGTPGATASRTRGSSFTRLAGRMNFSLTGDADAVNDEAAARRARASSAASLMAQDTSYDPAATLPRRPASYVSVTGSGSDRRASYNHTRDSAFDEYVLRQKEDRRDRSGSSASRVSSSSGREGSDGSSSPPATTTTSTTTTTSRARAESAAAYRLSLNLKNDVDDALSAEFGWGSVSRSSSQDSVMAGGQPAAIAVGGGVVTSAKSVRDSLGRAPSDGSERGALGSVNESGDDEEEEEEDQDEGHSSGDDWRRRNVDEASRALLGEGSREDGRAHPELLRPGRPKSEIEFVITPPPKSPSPGPNVRSTWGNAYAS